MHDRGLQSAGELDNLCMRACTPGAAEQGYPGCLIEKACQLPDIGLAWPQDRRSGRYPFGTSSSIFVSATSPGSTTTETPRLAIATRIARFKICGSCLGL